MGNGFSRISGTLMPDKEMANPPPVRIGEGADGAANFRAIRDGGFHGSQPLASNG